MWTILITLCIVCAVAALAKRIWPKDISKVEILMLVTVSVLLTTGIYFAGAYAQTADAEVWNGNEFQVAQTRLIDEKRAYVTSLETLPGKWIYGMMGFPSVNLDKYKPVLAADTSKVFETGVQAPVKLR
jgi:hypothetical protein